MVALAGMFAFPVTLRADNDDVVEYRQHVMKTLREQFESIEMILQGKAPPDNLATHARILAITASTAKKAFEPKVPGGESKPEIWTHWPDFSARLDALSMATEAFASAPKKDAAAAAMSKIDAAGLCKGCHDSYAADVTKK